jgi:hypothetical protein
MISSPLIINGRGDGRVPVLKSLVDKTQFKPRFQNRRYPGDTVGVFPVWTKPDVLLYNKNITKTKDKLKTY